MQQPLTFFPTAVTGTVPAYFLLEDSLGLVQRFKFFPHTTKTMVNIPFLKQNN